MPFLPDEEILPKKPSSFIPDPPVTKSFIPDQQDAADYAINKYVTPTFDKINDIRGEVKRTGNLLGAGAGAVAELAVRPFQPLIGQQQRPLKEIGEPVKQAGEKFDTGGTPNLDAIAGMAMIAMYGKEAIGVVKQLPQAYKEYLLKMSMRVASQKAKAAGKPVPDISTPYHPDLQIALAANRSTLRKEMARFDKVYKREILEKAAEKPITIAGLLPGKPPAPVPPPVTPSFVPDVPVVPPPVQSQAMAPGSITKPVSQPPIPEPIPDFLSKSIDAGADEVAYEAKMNAERESLTPEQVANLKSDRIKQYKKEMSGGGYATTGRMIDWVEENYGYIDPGDLRNMGEYSELSSGFRKRMGKGKLKKGETPKRTVTWDMVANAWNEEHGTNITGPDMLEQLHKEWLEEKAGDMPMAGGIMHDRTKLGNKLDKKGWEEGDLRNKVRLNQNMVVNDQITGEKVTINKGHEFTPIEVVDEKTGKPTNKFILQDGKIVIVDKSTYDRVKQQNIELGVKPEKAAPEVKEIEKLSGSRLFRANDSNRLAELRQKSRNDILSNAETDEMQALENIRLGKDETKFKQYTVPGGENYREILLQGETKAEPLSDMETKEMGRLMMKGNRTDAETARLRELGNRADAVPRDSLFKSSHWDEPNVIAHARVSDRTTPQGEKVLFIEEIQSDWARKGRELGFKEAAIKPTDNEIEAVANENNVFFSTDPVTGEVQIETREGRPLGRVHYASKSEALDKYYSGYPERFGGKQGVPSSPHLKNWQEVTLRRVLDRAVKEGYDRIAWATGEQTADHYKLSKKVQYIEWRRLASDHNIRRVYIQPKGGMEKINLTVEKDTGIITSAPAEMKAVGKHLSDAVGKNVAEKILTGDISGYISEEGLSVGGKWTENLYDRQIPNILKDITKKVGGKIDEIKIPVKMREDSRMNWSDAEIELHNYRGGQLTQQSLKITPLIKDWIKTGGTPLAGGMMHGGGPVDFGKTKQDLPETEQAALDAYEKQKDKWIGNTDYRVHESKLQKQNFQQELLGTLGLSKYNDIAKDYDKAIQIYIDSKRNPAHGLQFRPMLNDEQKRIFDLSQSLPPEIQAIADKMTDAYRSIGLEAQDKDVIRNVMDNYVGRIWDIEGKPGSQEYRKFGTKSRHAKPRVFDTIIQGQAAGYNLKVSGATNNLQILQEEMIKTIEDKQFMESLRKLKTIDGDPVITSKQLDGYVPIEHPNFTQWKPAGKADNADAMGRNFFVDKDGNIFEKKIMYAPKEYASNINNMLGSSKLKGIWPVDKVTKYNAIFKSWILQSSFFHHLAFMRSYYLGTNEKKWADMNPRQAYRSGLEAIKQESPIIELGIRNGLTLGLKQDWEESLLEEDTIIGKIIDKIPGGKPVKDKILELRKRQADFLFGELGAGLKAKAFLLGYAELQKKNPTMPADDVAKIVANLINDDFGGLHLKRIGRNPTVQHLFRIFALAPDWTESNIRSAVKAFHYTGKDGDKAEQEFYRRFWAGIITKGVAMSVLANYLLAAIDDDDAKNKTTYQKFLRNYRRAWKEGHLFWTGVDITPIYKATGGKTNERKYFSILGHFTDPLKFMLHPVRSTHHKGSVMYGTFYELFSGKDWAGRSFTPVKDLFKTGETVKWRPGGGPVDYETAPSYALSQLKGSQPVQIQNLISWMNGEMEGFDAIGNSLGLGVRSTYSSKSKKKSKAPRAPRRKRVSTSR